MTAHTENYAFTKDGKVFQKAFLNIPDREVGEVNDETPLSFYQHNFQKFENEVNDLFKKIDENENKGSFLSYLESLKNQALTIKGVGNVETIYKKINEYEVAIVKQIQANRTRNLSVKKGFLEELEQLAKADNTISVTDRINEIKSKWIRVGAVEKELQDELQKQFNQLIDTFFERFNKVIENDLNAYKKLIDESTQLLENEITASSKNRILEIQQEWKALPTLPKNVYVPLFKQIKEAHDKFFSLLNENNTKTKKQKETNQKGLEEKNKLIEQAKELLQNFSQKTIKDLQKLQNEWKNSTRVSNKMHEQLWDEFSTICDEFFEIKNLDTIIKKRKISNEYNVILFKINYLKDNIKKEKKKLQTVEENLGVFRLNISSKKVENMFVNQDKNTERKIIVKNKILKNLKEQLNGLEK